MNSEDWELVKHEAKDLLNIELKEIYSMREFIEYEQELRKDNQRDMLKSLSRDYPKLSKGIRDNDELKSWSDEINSSFYNLI